MIHHSRDWLIFVHVRHDFHIDNGKYNLDWVDIPWAKSIYCSNDVI